MATRRTANVDSRIRVRSTEPVMGYKLAIFDFDGTLADSFPWFLETINRLASENGFRGIAQAEVDSLRGYSADRLMKHLGIPFWRMPWIAREIRRSMAGDIERILPYPGVDGMLRTLGGRGVVLAIVTSNSYGNVCRVLGHESAAAIRYYECGAAIFGKRKKLRRVLRRSGTSPSDAIYIGDEIRDLQAARAEKIEFGAVAWGYTKVEALAFHGPTEVFGSIAEVAQKLA